MACAIAVLIVVFFHANFSWLPGGYVELMCFLLSQAFDYYYNRKEILQNSFFLSSFI
jgi:peptidoglycan/LPS O-acetylase OafA/YrhL